jgi:hypothetical protein
MDWKSYRPRLEALGKTLTADSRFRAVAEVYPALSLADFDDLTSSIIEQGLPGFEIWPGFLEFYSALDGFKLQWQYLGGGSVSTKTGSAQVAILPAIYLPEDAPQDSVKRMYSEPRILDLVGPDDHVALRLRPGSQAPDLLYFADLTRRYHQLSLDFESYLDLLLEARAMYRWQHFFVADQDFSVSKVQASEFRASLKFLFPDANADKFTARNER